MSEETTKNQQGDKLGDNISPKGVSSIRTYKNDLVDISQNKDQSLAHLVLKAQERKRQESYSEKVTVKDKATTKRVFLSSLILVVISIALVSTAYLLVKKPGLSSLSEQLIDSPIIADSHHTFNTNLISNEDFIDNVSSYLLTLNLQKGQIEHLYITDQIVSTKDSEMSLLTTQSFINLWENDISPLLSRSLNPDKYMFGVYSRLTDGQQSRFIIFKSNNFDSTFAGMLDWEDSMFFDMQNILNLSFDIEKKDFADELILNKDVRILKSIKEENLLMYSFTDRDTLVITSDKETFGAIIDHFKLPAPNLQ